MGDSLIGKTVDSGSIVLGSSPGLPDISQIKNHLLIGGFLRSRLEATLSPIKFIQEDSSRIR